MATQQLPWPTTAPIFVMTIALDGSPYRLKFSWNVRGEYWSMRVETSTGTVIAASIKVVLNQELISQFPGRGLPPGELRALRASESLAPIGRTEFGAGDVKLYYYPEADLV